MVGTLTPTRGRYAGYHVADARNFFIIYKYHMRSFIDIIQETPQSKSILMMLEDISKLKYHKSPYADDPEFSGRIPSTIKYWEDGLTLMSFEGDYIGLRKTVKPTIVDVPHNLMVSGQRRVTRAGVAQYLDNPTGKLPEVDLWQGRYIVLDGHHRIVADTLKGLKTTRCEVRDMNTIYGWEGYILKDIDRTDPEDRHFDWSLELTKRP